MTVDLIRRVILTGCLALMTAGTPAAGNTTHDGLRQSRYLGSLARDQQPDTSIPVLGEPRHNPLRPADVNIVVSGLPGGSGERIMASSNSASLRLLFPETEPDTGVAGTVAEPARQLLARPLIGTENRGIDLVELSASTRQPVTGSSMYADIRRWIQGVRQNAESGLATLWSNRQQELSAVRRPTIPVHSASVRKSGPTPQPPTTRSLQRPEFGTMDIFTVKKQPANAGSADVTRGWSTVEWANWMYVGCWFFDPRDGVPFETGQPIGEPESPSAAKPVEAGRPQTGRTLQVIQGRMATDEIGLDALPTLRDSAPRSRGRGIPALNISHRTVSGETSGTWNVLLTGFRSLVRALGQITEPFLDWAARWQIPDQTETLFRTLRSSIWPGHLGQGPRGLGIQL